jgi:Cytochrome P450
MTSAATSPITRAVMRVESSSTERDVDHLLSFQLGPGLAEVEQAANGLGAYIDELVEDRRASPRDDMVTSLVEASEDDDRLSQGELRAMIGGLLFAGYDTTRNQLGRAMVTFCHHPVQWDRLAAEPDLASRSVDEVMRLAGAVVGVPRIATEDLEIGGWAIPAGSLGVPHHDVGQSGRDRVRRGRDVRHHRGPGPLTSPSVVARTTAWVRTWLAPRWRRPSASCPADSARSGSAGSPRGERAPASVGRATCRSGSNPPGDRSAASRRCETRLAAIDPHRGAVARSCQPCSGPLQPIRTPRLFRRFGGQL